MKASSPSLRRAVLVAAASGCLLALSPASAAFVPAPALAAEHQLGWGDAAKFTTTRESSVPHIADKPLSVKAENGGIKVVQTTGDTVTVSAKIRATTQERLDGANVVTTRDADGTLQVSVKWPDNSRKGSEGCDFEIGIPNISRLDAATSNGAIDVSGLAGPAVLGTSNASIAVNAWEGDVKAATSNGQVTLSVIDGKAEVTTSNGRIEVKDVAGSVSADTSNASVRVELRSSSKGPVNVETSNGSVHVVVGRAFIGAVDAGTSNGRVTMKGPGITPKGKPGKEKGSWQFGSGGEASRLESSNGSVTVEVLE